MIILNIVFVCNDLQYAFPSLVKVSFFIYSHKIIYLQKIFHEKINTGVIRPRFYSAADTYCLFTYKIVSVRKRQSDNPFQYICFVYDLQYISLLIKASLCYTFLKNKQYTDVTFLG